MRHEERSYDVTCLGGHPCLFGGAAHKTKAKNNESQKQSRIATVQQRHVTTGGTTFIPSRPVYPQLSVWRETLLECHLLTANIQLYFPHR